MNRRFSLYAGDPIARVLASTKDDQPDGNRSGRLNMVAYRYLDMVADALRAEPLASLSQAEWCAIAEANSPEIEPGGGPSGLWATLADSPGVGAKWGVDAHELAQRLSVASQRDLWAVAEVIDRVWSRPDLQIDAALTIAGVRPRLTP